MSPPRHPAARLSAIAATFATAGTTASTLSITSLCPPASSSACVCRPSSRQVRTNAMNPATEAHSSGRRLAPGAWSSCIS